MKKLLVFAILICVVTAFGFADKFTVQSVTGRVERESGAQKVAVNAGDVLDGSVLIRTFAAASVVLRDEKGKTVTVSARRNGSIAELVKASSGVQIGGNISHTETGTVNLTGAQSGTASARSSDAAGDDGIAAE